MNVINEFLFKINLNIKLKPDELMQISSFTSLDKMRIINQFNNSKIKSYGCISSTK